MNNTTISSGTGRPTRRQFGRAVAGAAMGVIAMPAIVRGRNLNEKLNIAMIGYAAPSRRGAFNLKQVKSENIVALCDVLDPADDTIAAQYPKAKKYRDFRKLYDHANQFDAVVVSTTEHTHAFATLPALQLGKHVYCEKPLTYNIAEARVIREAAARTKVATQMGTQVHAGDNYRRVVELIQAGAIGPVHEVHLWVSRAWGRQPKEASDKNKDVLFVLERPEETQSVPAGLDWDLWLGPAPARPFHSAYYPGPRWYRWWDFGNGTMSDLGSHRNDLAFWALKLQAPRTIEAFGPPPHPEIAPASMHVVYEYGPRGDQPPVNLHWYQGTEKPQAWRDGTIPDRRSGATAPCSSAPRGCCSPDTTSACSCPRKTSATSRRRSRPSPSRWATGPSGFTPPRPASRRPATSSTPAGSPRPTTWATSRIAPARSSSGMPRRCTPTTPRRPRRSSTANIARDGRWPRAAHAWVAHGAVGCPVRLSSSILYAVHDFITSRRTRCWIGRRDRRILLCALCE